MGDLYYRGLQAKMMRQRRVESEVALRAQKEVDGCTWRPQINENYLSSSSNSERPSLVASASTMHDFGRKWDEDRNHKIARLQAQLESKERAMNPNSPQVDPRHKRKTDLILSGAGGYVDPQTSWKQRAQRYHEVRAGLDAEPLEVQRAATGTHWREVVERLYPKGTNTESAPSDFPKISLLEEDEDEQSEDVNRVVLTSHARASPRIMELYEEGRQKVERARRPPALPEESGMQEKVAQLLGEAAPIEPRPALNKKSLKMAESLERKPLHWRARPSGSKSFDPPLRHQGLDVKERLKDFTSRSINYEEWKARKLEDRRAQRDAQEIAGCTFAPQTLDVPTPYRDHKRPLNIVHLGLDADDPTDEYLQQAARAIEAWEYAQLQAAELVREAVAKGSLNVTDLTPPKESDVDKDLSPAPEAQGKDGKAKKSSPLVAFGHRVDPPLVRKTVNLKPTNSPREPATNSPRGHQKQQGARPSNFSSAPVSPRGAGDAVSTPRTAPPYAPRATPAHQKTDSMNRVPPDAPMQVAAAGASWSARAAPKTKPVSKTQTLYEQGAVRRQIKQVQEEVAQQKRIEQEMEGCTFRPKLHSWIRK